MLAILGIKAWIHVILAGFKVLMLFYISIAAILVSSITLYFNWKTNRNSIYLSVLLLIISIHGISHSLLLAREPIWMIAIFFNNFSPLYFLAGPLLFFYVKGTLKDDWRLNSVHIFHCIPFFVFFFIVSPYLFSPYENKLKFIQYMSENADNVINLNPNKIFSNVENLCIRASLVMIYSIASLYTLFKYHPSKNEKKAIPTIQLKITYRWLLILVTSILIIGAGSLLTALQYIIPALKLTSDPTGSDSPFALISIFAFLTIPITLLFIPQILYGIPIDRKKLEEQNVATEDSLAINSEKAPSSIENEIENIDEPFSGLATQILEYLHKEKPFLQPDYSMDDLAREFDIPRHHLYYCMNKVIKLKFTELKKKLRIEHAKKMLQEGKYKTLSIEGIGAQSGFSSRSNFFTTFKSEVGMTPTEYLESLNSDQ